MKITVAYIEEPPFGWTGEDQAAKGADVELAEVVLRAIGVSRIEYHLTSFSELLTGVREGRWDMNVPLFVTPERAEHVAFSLPVWAIGDGFLVQKGNPKVLTSYAAVARREDARLGIIHGQVQFDSAKASGVSDAQIIRFKEQPDALAALRSGTIDAYASTAVGNRVLASGISNSGLEAVAHENNGSFPVGAFSFNKRNHRLVQLVNERLQVYLGSVEHRARMAKFGLTRIEIDGAICDRTSTGKLCFAAAATKPR
jgi:polar amino acid transport system substrate-binding protein